MFSKNNSRVFVSTNNFEYKFVDVDELIKNKHTYFVLSVHTGFRHYDFTPISRLETNVVNNCSGIKLTFENVKGTIFELPIMFEMQKIYTRNRNYITATKINNLDVFMDHEGYFCKLVTKKRVYIKEEEEFVKIDILYNNNFVCNGIVIKDNI